MSNYKRSNNLNNCDYFHLILLVLSCIEDISIPNIVYEYYTFLLFLPYCSYLSKIQNSCLNLFIRQKFSNKRKTISKITYLLHFTASIIITHKFFSFILTNYSRIIHLLIDLKRRSIPRKEFQKKKKKGKTFPTLNLETKGEIRVNYSRISVYIPIP